MDISIKETDKYGKSLYTERPFKTGELIFTICGPIVKTPTVYTIPITDELLIDPQPYGKYLCHSCNPNCGIKSRTLVMAMRDIEKGEEITIDYAMIVYEYGDEISEKERICRCGNQNCRGSFGSYKELSDELKQKYRGFISEYLTD